MAENDATTGLTAQIENQIDRLHDVDALLLAIQRLAESASDPASHAIHRLAILAAGKVSGVLAALDVVAIQAIPGGVVGHGDGPLRVVA